MCSSTIPFPASIASQGNYWKEEEGGGGESIDVFVHYTLSCLYSYTVKSALSV